LAVVSAAPAALSAMVWPALVWPALVWPETELVPGTVRIPCKRPLCIFDPTVRDSRYTTACNPPPLGSALGTVHILCKRPICIFDPTVLDFRCTTTCNHPARKMCNPCKLSIRMTNQCKTIGIRVSTLGKTNNLCKLPNSIGISYCKS